MIHFLLICSISFVLIGLILLLSRVKKIPLKTVVGLFLFGALLATPFVMVEYFASSLRFYMVILAFIGIELFILACEEHIKLFHDLIHHNVRHLRIASFILIGMGFTYFEVVSYLVHATGNLNEILSILPFKALFGILIHTVLTSASSIANIGTFFAETVYETIFKFIGYYLRIAIIGVSHYMYVFFTEYHFSLIAIPFVALNVVLFLWLKAYLDQKTMITAD